jgi:hypothetical protein
MPAAQRQPMRRRHGPPAARAWPVNGVESRKDFCHLPLHAADTHVADVAFDAERFAFPASFRTAPTYMRIIQQRDAPLLANSQGTRCFRTARSIAMSIFSRLFSTRRNANPVTTRERQELLRSMPGQAGALAGARLGFLVR